MRVVSSRSCCIELDRRIEAFATEQSSSQLRVCLMTGGVVGVWHGFSRQRWRVRSGWRPRRRASAREDDGCWSGVRGETHRDGAFVGLGIALAHRRPPYWSCRDATVHGVGAADASRAVGGPRLGGGSEDGCQRGQACPMVRGRAAQPCNGFWLGDAVGALKLAGRSCLGENGPSWVERQIPGRRPRFGRARGTKNGAVGPVCVDSERRPLRGCSTCRTRRDGCSFAAG